MVEEQDGFHDLDDHFAKVLQQAYHFHKNNDLSNASKHYEQLLHLTSPPLVVYQNLISVYRIQKRFDEALSLASDAISTYGHQHSIYLNSGNILAEREQWTEAVQSYRASLSLDHSCLNSISGLQKSLRNLGLFYLAYRSTVIFFTNARKQIKGKVLPLLLDIVLEIKKKKIDDKATFDTLFQELYLNLQLYKPTALDSNFRLSLMLAQYYSFYDEFDSASKELLKARNILGELSSSSMLGKLTDHDFKVWHNSNWNSSLHFLKAGKFEMGWKLYEHGLAVEAQPKQRFQRAFSPLFTHSDIPIWEGESLTGKNILIYGEQAIGDTIMFSVLLHCLRDAKQIYFLAGQRLHDIYKHFFRSCHNLVAITRDEILSLGNSEFHFQLPIGSLPKFFLKSPITFSEPHFSLEPASTSSDLRAKYLSHADSPNPLIVGISWQGGIPGPRLNKKSMKLIDILRILYRPGFLFVSLQYGDDQPFLEQLSANHGFNVVHDDTIDPIKDFKGFLHQVNAVDCVLSVANTTVHAAGMLRKPTFTFVSNESDWRWIHPSIYQGCYWYPTVTAGYQDGQGRWDNAILESLSWLNDQKLQ